MLVVLARVINRYTAPGNPGLFYRVTTVYLCKAVVFQLLLPDSWPDARTDRPRMCNCCRSSTGRCGHHAPTRLARTLCTRRRGMHRRRRGSAGTSARGTPMPRYTKRLKTMGEPSFFVWTICTKLRTLNFNNLARVERECCSKKSL